MRQGKSAGLGLTEVGVVTCDPVLPGRGEDVEVNRVFEGFCRVGDIRGDDENLPGVHGVGLASKVETEDSLKDEGDLFVRVGVLGHDAAFFQDDAGEHALPAGDELAGEERVELLGRD